MEIQCDEKNNISKMTLWVNDKIIHDLTKAKELLPEEEKLKDGHTIKRTFNEKWHS